MKQKQRLTELEKIEIIKSYDNKSIGLISKEINRPRSTIFSFYSRWLQRKTIINNSSPGRPRKLRLREIKKVESFIKRNPNCVLKNIVQILGLPISLQTLSAILKKLGYFYLKKRIKQKLTPSNIKARLDFAKKFSSWNIRDWSRIMWSDESSFEWTKRYSESFWRKKGQSFIKGNFFANNQSFIKRYVK